MSDDTEKPANDEEIARSPLLTENPLLKHRDALDAEIKRIEAMTAPLRQQRDALQAQIQPIEDQMRALAKRYMQIERTAGLFELKQTHAQICRAMGGRVMSEGQEQPPADGEPGIEEGELIENVNYEDGGGDQE